MSRSHAPACYTIDVDGEPASVRLSSPPSDLSEFELDAIRDVIRAARRRLEAMPHTEPESLEALEHELAECVTQHDALPAHHARRLPLARRIRRLSMWTQAMRAERAR